MKTKWIIYWVANNEEQLMLIYVVLVFIFLGALWWEFYILSVIAAILDILLLISIDYCVKYTINRKRKIK